MSGPGTPHNVTVAHPPQASPAQGSSGQGGSPPLVAPQPRPPQQQQQQWGPPNQAGASNQPLPPPGPNSAVLSQLAGLPPSLSPLLNFQNQTMHTDSPHASNAPTPHPLQPQLPPVTTSLLSALQPFGVPQFPLFPAQNAQPLLGGGHQAILQQLKASSDLQRIVQLQIQYLVSSLLQSGLTIDQISFLMGQNASFGQQSLAGSQFTTPTQPQTPVQRQAKAAGQSPMQGPMQGTAQASSQENIGPQSSGANNGAQHGPNSPAMTSLQYQALQSQVLQAQLLQSQSLQLAPQSSPPQNLTPQNPMTQNSTLRDSMPNSTPQNPSPQNLPPQNPSPQTAAQQSLPAQFQVSPSQVFQSTQSDNLPELKEQSTLVSNPTTKDESTLQLPTQNVPSPIMPLQRGQGLMPSQLNHQRHNDISPTPIETLSNQSQATKAPSQHSVTTSPALPPMSSASSDADRDRRDAQRFRHVLPESLRSNAQTAEYVSSATTDAPDDSNGSARTNVDLDANEDYKWGENGEPLQRKSAGRKLDRSVGRPRTKNKVDNLNSQDDPLRHSRDMSITVSDPAFQGRPDSNDSKSGSAAKPSNEFDPPRRNTFFARFVEVNPALKSQWSQHRVGRPPKKREEEPSSAEVDSDVVAQPEAESGPKMEVKVPKKRGRKPGSQNKPRPIITLDGDSKTRREARAKERRQRESRLRGSETSDGPKTEVSTTTNSASRAPARQNSQSLSVDVPHSALPPPVQPQSAAAQSESGPKGKTPVSRSTRRMSSDSANSATNRSSKNSKRFEGPRERQKSGAPPPVMPLNSRYQPESDEDYDSEEDDEEEQSEQSEEDDWDPVSSYQAKRRAKQRNPRGKRTKVTDTRLGQESASNPSDSNPSDSSSD